jgi:septum formation protein
MAVEKATAGWQMATNDPRPVMGADTVVVLDDAVMGKPQDRDDGIAMLQRLSGRSHRVMSAVALVGLNTGGQAIVRLNCSVVTFRNLSPAECEAYWGTGEPVDKAGAYAIQGRAAAFITRLEGSYSGVMGLPLYETAELLQVCTGN